MSRGKHLLWRLSGEVTIHTHFKMDGSWHLYRHGQRWRSPGFEARAVLETERWQAVGFRVPVLDLVASEREDDLVGHLGPDLLGDDWDAEEATARLEARTEMTIGEALLDQTVLAGVGNVYRCELCFLRGRTHWVYGRMDKPCRRCGTPIRRVDQPSYGSERIVYWCPSCQPSQERKGGS